MGKITLTLDVKTIVFMVALYALAYFVKYVKVIFPYVGT